MKPGSETTFLLVKNPPGGEAERMRKIAHIVHYLEELPLDQGFKGVFSRVQRTRSLAQNAYLWGVVYATICGHLEGWDAEDVHEYCLGECYGWERKPANGVIKRARVVPVRRSHNMSVSEFMHYIEWIQRHFAEKGIDIPNPNEGETW